MADLILSLVRNEPLLTEDIQIIKPEGPHKAVTQVLKRAKALAPVTDAISQREAGIVASELQGLRKGLETTYRAAKTPFVAGGRALDQIYHDIDGPLERAYKNVTAMVAKYQDEERRKQELARARAEAEARQKEEAERVRLAAIERERQAAEMKARMAEDPRERMDSQRTAAQLAAAADEQRIVMELQREELPMAPVPQTPKPVGGRVYDDYDITVVDIRAFAAAHPELVEITPKRGAIKEAIRLLDEAGKPLQMAGLRIYKQTKASFVGASAIRIAKE
jgi:hypothetical protein